MQLPELQIGGILLAPIIVAVVEAAKLAGLPTPWARWLSAILSVAGYAATFAIANRPDLLEPISIALNALVIFLTTAGLYHQAKAALSEAHSV
jgi:hypothetical protein